MSDNLSARWNQILHMENKDTSQEVVIARENYDDFSKPTVLRTHEIVTEDRIFYVNPGFLAEYSPYFSNIFFVQGLKQCTLNNTPSAELLEFLRCITFCPMRKPLTVNNVSLVLTYANKFEMRPVRARCEHFVLSNANLLGKDKAKLLQVTSAISQCDPNSSTMSVLVERIASIKYEELDPMVFNKIPGEVVAEVFSQKMNRNKSRNRDGETGCCVMSWLTSLFRRNRNRQHGISQQSTILG